MDAFFPLNYPFFLTERAVCCTHALLSFFFFSFKIYLRSHSEFRQIFLTVSPFHGCIIVYSTSFCRLSIQFQCFAIVDNATIIKNLFLCWFVFVEIHVQRRFRGELLRFRGECICCFASSFQIPLLGPCLALCPTPPSLGTYGDPVCPELP